MAQVHSPTTGRTLEVWTTEPVIQVYTAAALGNYNISNLSNALSALTDSSEDTTGYQGISNLNSYVNIAYKLSQLSVSDELSSISSLLDTSSGYTNINSSVLQAYKTYSALSSSSTSGSFDVEV
ncbi:MAG: hypothetical protein HGA22_07440 [Clostridiales bacterium]|nr:hypothetical protein [Clostridiales bacterium]